MVASPAPTPRPASPVTAARPLPPTRSSPPPSSPSSTTTTATTATTMTDLSVSSAVTSTSPAAASVAAARKRRAAKHQFLDPLQLLTLVVTGSATRGDAMGVSSGGVKKKGVVPGSGKGAPTSTAVGGKLMCSLCASTFGRRCELKRHIGEVHSNNGARRFRCTHPSCGKSFTRRDALAKHHVVKHQGKRRFVCPTCSEKFTSRYDLSRHSIRVHSNVKKRFTCEHCNAGFSQKSQLTMHKGRVHAGLEQNESKASASPASSGAIAKPRSAKKAAQCDDAKDMTSRAPQSGAIDSLAAVAAVALAAENGHVGGDDKTGSGSGSGGVLGADALLEAAAKLRPQPRPRPQPESSNDNDRHTDQKDGAVCSAERRGRGALSETAGSTADTEAGCARSEFGDDSGPLGDEDMGVRAQASSKAQQSPTTPISRPPSVSEPAPKPASTPVPMVTTPAPVPRLVKRAAVELSSPQTTPPPPSKPTTTPVTPAATPTTPASVSPSTPASSGPPAPAVPMDSEAPVAGTQDVSTPQDVVMKDGDADSAENAC